MQYRPPNANLDSGCQTVYIVTGHNGLQTLLVGRTWPTLLVIRLVHWCFFVNCGTGHNTHIVLLTKLRYADKCIVNESGHRKEQLATIIHTIQYQMLTLFTWFTFAKRRIRPPEEVSNTNHFGSVSDSLCRLAAVSECMASVCCLTIIMLYNFRVITMSRYCLINCIDYSSPKTL